jgi:hypothetical protein
MQRSSLGQCIHHAGGWHNDQLGQDHTTTKVRFKVDGLTPYKAYWFAVQALGTDGPGAMSIPIIGRSA